MLCFVLGYRQVIDTVTADKALKLHKFELDDDEWKIVADLVFVLQVCGSDITTPATLILSTEIQEGDSVFLEG